MSRIPVYTGSSVSGQVCDATAMAGELMVDGESETRVSCFGFERAGVVRVG